MNRLIATRGQRNMAIFLCVDIFIFLALFAGYIYLRVQTTVWPAQFHFASGLMTVAITFFAAAGSVTMFYAARHQAQQSYEIAMRLVVATLAVWGAIVIGVGMEWVRLIMIMEIGFTTNTFSLTYFTLTGLYIVHVLVGFVYQGVVAARIRTADVGAAALFVYATTLIWLIIFVGVYLTSTDLQGI